MRTFTLLCWLVLIPPVLEAQDGQHLFNRICAACHQPNARGVPNAFPELHEHVACEARVPGGRSYLAGVLKHGLEGPISVDGAEYDGYMPVITQLSSEEKAAVLNYVISLSARCPGPIEPFTAAEVEAALNDPKWNSESLHNLREAVVGTPTTRNTEDRPPATLVPTSRHLQAALDYTLHCQGCHAAKGEGVPGYVPPLRNNASRFLRTAQGRTFLIKVPGVAFSSLDDARLANLLNWMVECLDGANLPHPFVPYTAAEIAANRQQSFVDVDLARAQVLAQLATTTAPLPR